MKESDVRARAFAMPLTSPAYPVGPYRFVNREFLIVTYRTDPQKLRELVPEPLQIEEPLVKFEFIRMPDSTGFGDYTESGQVKIGDDVHAGYVNLKGAWTGPAALTLSSHALAPLAELPVLEIASVNSYSTSSQMRGVPSTCGTILSRKFGAKSDAMAAS